MYRKIKQSKPICRICFEEWILGHNFLTWFLYGEVLCEKCRKKMNGEWKVIKRFDLKIHTLYKYEEFARDQLLKYKDNNDKWLKDIFLSPHLTYFYFNFFNYKIVYAPSHTKKTDQRGYIPNQLILKTQYLEVIDDVFIKNKEYKQSTIHRSKRHKIKEVISLKNPASIKNENILLFDDLCTTGNTLKACVDLIKPHAKSVEVLALFHHEI